MQRTMQGSINRWSWRSLAAGVFALGLFALMGGRGEALSVEPALDDDEPVTFAADVAIILQERCQECHQSGSIGPMSLLTYEEVRPWGPLIRDRVIQREMPPYQYDVDTGIQELKYDPRLTEEELRTIVAWIDQGMPLGDPADMPPPAVWPDPSQYRLTERFGRPPDVVVASDPYTIPAVGQDRWWRTSAPTGITEERCIMAIETHPSVEGRQVTHHANTSFRVEGGGGGRLSEYAIGKIGELIPEGACRTAPANSEVSWDIHYWPNGKEVIDDQVEVGIWLYPEDYEGQYRQSLSLYGLQGGHGFDIPPGGTLMTQGFHSFDTPVRIDSWQPHGHTRLVAASIQVLRTNGRREMVSMVSNWSALWHHSHIYQDHVAPLLDVGDQLILTMWYDNSANNRYNPDPEQWVGIGDRTADEMSHNWIAVTHLDQEGYERILAERQAAPASD